MTLARNNPGASEAAGADESALDVRTGTDHTESWNELLYEIGFRRMGRSWPVAPTYPPEQLTEEVSFIAYHFHWPLDAILGLEHAERRMWVEEISKLNERINSEAPVAS